MRIQVYKLDDKDCTPEIDEYCVNIFSHPERPHILRLMYVNDPHMGVRFTDVDTNQYIVDIV